MAGGETGSGAGEGRRATGRDDGAPAVRLAVYRVRLERERYLSFPWRAFGGPEDAVALFRRYAGVPDREHMIAIHLDARGRVSGLHTVSVGSLQRSEAGAREVFKAAILGSAAGIVLVHNHPSGDPAPSPEDVAVAQGLELVGQLLGIPVVDHVIVGEPGYASLRDLGLLEFDAQDPDPLRPQNTDEGWAAGLDTLKFGADFLSGGMAAVRRQARRGGDSRCGRAFIPVPARSVTLNPMITVEPDPSLRPEEVEPLLEELQRRVGAALERAVEGIAATIRIDDVGMSFAREAPVFPVAAGPRVFRDSSPWMRGGGGRASRPPIRGIDRFITTTPGRTSSTMRIPSSPSAASPALVAGSGFDHGAGHPRPERPARSVPHRRCAGSRVRSVTLSSQKHPGEGLHLVPLMHCGIHRVARGVVADLACKRGFASPLWHELFARDLSR